jgi:hypothetical protein
MNAFILALLLNFPRQLAKTELHFVAKDNPP